MSDIMKFILNEDASGKDPEGNMLELGEWSEAEARRLAEAEGFALTDAHMEVAVFLREHYRKHGAEESARALTEVLDAAFADKGGSRYLFQLYPGGPVSQASRIAGLPVPGHAADASFGTVQ